MRIIRNLLEIVVSWKDLVYFQLRTNPKGNTFISFKSGFKIGADLFHRKIGFLIEFRLHPLNKKNDYLLDKNPEAV